MNRKTFLKRFAGIVATVAVLKENPFPQPEPKEEYILWGDGFHDDTEAIQALIDAAAKDGGTVFFPKGDYLITAPIIMDDSRSWNIHGNGARFIAGKDLPFFFHITSKDLMTI